MRRWAAALALTIVPPLAAQLREVRPAHTAFAFGWSDVTGYGTALALLQRLPHAPVGLGVAAGGGGVGAHAQVQLPDPFFLPPREDHEPLLYLSVGMARLFGRNEPGVARVEWAALLGSELWPDTRPGLFFDLGYGVVGTIGGNTPGGHGGGMTLRFLMGWAF